MVETVDQMIYKDCPVGDLRDQRNIRAKRIGLRPHDYDG